MKIGFVGVPPKLLINELKKDYPKATWLDLDVPTKNDKKLATLYIPDTTCSVIQTILTNAILTKPDLLIATIGSSKCDSMNFLIPIIKNILPKTKIIETYNYDNKNHGTQISESNLPLVEKFELITKNVIEYTNTIFKKSKPKAGFWGVPPYDYSILKLFPSETHIFGWTRCMENKTPSNLELELFVNDKIPTVFYSQSFCQKNILAKELARKYKGLYVEVDGLIDSSTKAKINAFLELKNCF